MQFLLIQRHVRTHKALRHGSHSFIHANYTMSAFSFCKRSPDGATPNCMKWKASDWSLLLIYRPGRGERLSCSDWLTYSGWFAHIAVTHRLQVERRTGKFAGERPTLYRYSTQPAQLLGDFVPRRPTEALPRDPTGTSVLRPLDELLPLPLPKFWIHPCDP